MEYQLTEEQQMVIDSVAGTLARTGAGGWSALEALGVAELEPGVDMALVLEEAGAVALDGPVIDNLLVKNGLSVDGVSLKGTVACAPDGATIAWADRADWLLLWHQGAIHKVAPASTELSSLETVDPARTLARVEWTPGADTLLSDDPDTVSAAFDRGALGAAAMLVGLGRAMVALAVEYAKTRQQFGKPIGAQQAVQHHLVNAHLAVELSRPLVHRAAWSPDPVHVSMAKAFASDAACKAAELSLQVHGAIGYSYEYELHGLMKRAWALAASWGDAAWHRERVARARLQ
ncbi:MAG: hypothetical protein ACI9WU_001734 [Myxococcota bacterium]|jgi:hypothetical protein